MVNQFNPMQLISMIKNGKNPQQLMMSLLQQRMSGNPMMENIFAMAQQGNYRGIETVARNLAKQRGIDFDKEFTAFKNNFGL